MKALADLCIYEYSLLSFYPKHILAKSITYLSKNLTKE